MFRIHSSATSSSIAGQGHGGKNHTGGVFNAPQAYGAAILTVESRPSQLSWSGQCIVKTTWASGGRGSVGKSAGPARSCRSSWVAVECQLDDVGDVNRASVGRLRDLFAAAEAVGDDERVSRSLADRRE